MAKASRNLDLTYLEATKQKVETCPVCGARGFEIFSQGPSVGGLHLAYAICKDCGHIYMKDRPSAEGYARFYISGDYRRMTGEEMKTNALRDDEAAFKKRYAHGERLFEEYMKGRLGPEDIVFDFGCGDGAWLYGLHQKSGCRVDGNEPSADDVAFIKDKLGVEIFHGLVEDCRAAILDKYTGKVKLAIVSGSLQHMLDPMSCLQLAHKMLADDGFLYVCNKNLFVHYLPVTGPYPRPFAELRTVDHPHYYHEEAYRFMLEKAGFEIVAFSNDSKVRVAHMEALVRKRPAAAQAPTPKGNYAEIIARIRKMDKAVAIYRCLPLRAWRFLKRKLGLA